MTNIRLPLTQKQKKILRRVIEIIRKKGYPPTVYELRDDLNIKNVGTVISHLAALEKKGYISKIKRQERGIRLTEITDNMTLKQVDALAEKKHV